MKYYNDGFTLHAYDLEYSKHHYGLVAIPAVYGRTARKTFITNEEGIVYWKDLKKSEYLETYPGPDPTIHGWNIAK